MIKFLLPVILFLLGVTGFAQKDSVRKYLDADLQFTSKKEAVYEAMAIKENDHWMLYAVYPDTSVLLKIYFKDADLAIMDGPYLLYHGKGVPAQKGNYKNNIPDGHWQSWYPDGQLKNDGYIVNNHLSGTWKSWYENGQMISEESYAHVEPADAGESVHENSPVSKVQRIKIEFSAEGVQEGPANTWYKNGNKESEVNYHNDTLTGVCTWYRENGHLSSRETYVNGKVNELECYDENGSNTNATCSIMKQPVFINPVYSAEDYIVAELHKVRHNDIANFGEASVSFTVTKKGTVERLVISQSPDAALSKYITQIISRMIAWSPAVTHNRMVDYTVKLVIPYYR